MSEGTKVSSLAVADVLLRSALDSNARDMSNLKLNKLVYIAHGWQLGLHGRLLVEDEKVEIWPYGPVFPKLYCSIKLRHVKDGVRPRDPILEKDFFKDHRIELDQSSMKLIKLIYSIYKDFTAGKLIDLTHKTGAPWDLAKKMDLDTIPDDMIQDYYNKLLNRPGG